MAERRMFAKTIIDSDAFLDMPISSQLLYFHLSMRADDEGFINKPKTVIRMVGAKDDDMSVLIVKKFIIPFESGVVVIKHWRIHNYLQNDRITETRYKEEKSLLELDENKGYRKKNVDVYSLPVKCIQNTEECYTQVSLGKGSIGKDRIGKDSKALVICNDRDDWFKEFWMAYPNKVQKKSSEQKFKLHVKNELTFNAIMFDLSTRVNSKEWTKENGQYIPNPTTYLNQRRWEDEKKPIKKVASFLDMLKEIENEHN